MKLAVLQRIPYKRLRRIGGSGIAAVASTVAAIHLAAPVNAQGGGAPCPLAMILFCSIAPTLPNLDHDVDLTKDPNALNGVGIDGQSPVDPGNPVPPAP